MKLDYCHWLHPFVWLVVAGLGVGLYFMWALVEFTQGVFQSPENLIEKALAIRFTQMIVGQYYGFFIVVLGAIWAFFGVRGGGAEGNVDGKTMPFRIEWRAFGISAVLALCGTFILIFCLWREIEVSRYSTSPQAKSSFVLPRPSGKMPDNIAEIMQYERDNPPGKSAAPSE